MTRRTKRTASIQKVINKNYIAKFLLYSPNQNLPDSNFEEFYYHSTEIKQLWLVGNELSQDYTVSIYSGGFQSSSYLLIPSIIVPAGDSMVNVMDKFPFTGVRGTFEMSVWQQLAIEVSPKPEGSQIIIVNGFAEETGFANELNPTQ